MAKLIKIDRNGSKHYEGYVSCDKCGGDGVYKWGAFRMENGVAVPQYAGICWKCDGNGKLLKKWIERTPEYQAKLDAKREAKHAKEYEEKREAIEAEQKRIAEETAQREAAEAARKAVSQYVGIIGNKITVKCSYDHCANFETLDFYGHPTKVFIHTFKDVDGNKLIWKTGTGFPGGREWNYGEPVDLTGTVKAHNEYDGEKQTVLIRCKLNKPT